MTSTDARFELFVECGDPHDGFARIYSTRADTTNCSRFRARRGTPARAAAQSACWWTPGAGLAFDHSGEGAGIRRANTEMARRDAKFGKRESLPTILRACEMRRLAEQAALY